MPRHHMIDGAQVAFTPEEEAERDVQEQAWADGAAARAAEEVRRNRHDAYQAEADALYFEEQRGEVSQGTWTAKVDEIKLRFPK